MDTVTREKRKEIMSGIKGKNTHPELIVRTRLHRFGYRFRIHDKKLAGKPDIVFARYKTVIFINGCFWHQHPGCRLAKIPKSRTSFWHNKLTQNIKRQKRDIKILKQLGYQVIMVWECQTYKNPKKIIGEVIGKLKRFHQRR